ncbi:hypothetical protein QDY72_09135 [Kingella negevensis]|nr:hypothetical protein [Kingella negevensis]MDK4685325.1 hypothetical protein [Kingella negevensis]MDK4706794.1 hypothetical protein [Kingella negevensis]
MQASQRSRPKAEKQFRILRWVATCIRLAYLLLGGFAVFGALI